MASIERTAYPRFNTTRALKEQELEQFYSLTPDELRYAKKHIRGDFMRLNFAIQLKAFQRLGYFPELKRIPKVIVEHIKKCLGLFDEKMMPHYDHDKSRYRHCNHICDYLKIKRWRKNKRHLAGEPIHPGRHFAIQIAYQAAQTMNHPADIINVVIEELIHHCYELPPFAQLNSLVKHTRSLVNRKIFKTIYDQLGDDFLERLDDLFVIKPGYSRTGYHALKRLPKSPTITNFKELIEHHNWLMSFEDIDAYLDGISKIKLQQFAAEAKSLDASDFKNMSQHRQYSLILCLLYQAQRKAKDSLAVMYSGSLSKMHKKVNKKLTDLRKKEEAKTKHLVGAFRDVISVCKEKPIAYTELGKSVIQAMSHHGGVDFLHDECEEVSALYCDSYFALLWDFFASSRPTLFKLVRILKLQAASQNQIILTALDTVLNNFHNKDKYLIEDVDVSFLPEKWRKLVCIKTDSRTQISRRHLEMAVFSCIASELRSGDIFIHGAQTYSDYRKELLPWESCKPLLNDFCNDAGIANNAKELVKALKNRLNKTANRVDIQYPDIAELIIDNSGNPILKRRSAKKRTPQAIWLAEEVKNRMPERNLMDILCNAHHYTEWAQQFGPITGFDSKISDPIERYIVTNFAYGTPMGPTQTSKHLKADMSAHMLSWINRRHITPSLLNKALTKLINFSHGFQLPKAWGTGKSSAFDGTLCYIREENLIAEYHIRYGHRGGIAYHHVSDQYIALFSTFIPCGVWEAVEIIDALLNNESDIQPDIIHADTQGQSTVVFALAYLFGIKLMLRIRNWKDLKLFRPTEDAKYNNIDSLFCDSSINWDLIETHWQDFMQVVLSIKQGKLSSSLLLRKLNNYSRKNRLYRAFQELGYVIRTIFLLEYISNVELRETITAETNKVEQYNQLCEWASFGAVELVASNDEDEMEKAVKYCDIITNSIILQNIIDMSDIIHQLTQESADIREDDIAFLSPYMTEHIKRFGDYFIDIGQIPNQISEGARSLHSVKWMRQAA